MPIKKLKLGKGFTASKPQDSTLGPTKKIPQAHSFLGCGLGRDHNARRRVFCYQKPITQWTYILGISSYTFCELESFVATRAIRQWELLPQAQHKIQLVQKSFDVVLRAGLRN